MRQPIEGKRVRRVALNHRERIERIERIEATVDARRFGIAVIR
jgi:hypothetical protein